MAALLRRGLFLDAEQRDPELIHDLRHKYEKWQARLNFALLEATINSLSKPTEIGRGGFGAVYKAFIGAEAVAVKKLSNMEIVYDASFHQDVPFVGYRSDNSTASQMQPSWISGANFSTVRNSAIFDGLHNVRPAAIGVAKGQTIKRNSSVCCALANMFLSRQSLDQKTRYLKWNGTFRRYSSLTMPTEAPTEKKTVANGNGKGADNGSSEEVSLFQANHGLKSSTETPISQRGRSSISSGSDEPATVDNSSITSSRTLESTWYIASAAAHHMTGVLDLLTSYTRMSGDLIVHTPNMGCMRVLGSGPVNTGNVTLQDVWYVPGLDSNLVSASQLAKLGHTISFGPYGCRINKGSEDGALVGSAHFTDDYLFAVDFLDAQPTN